jgi:hypothetical protein
LIGVDVAQVTLERVESLSVPEAVKPPGGMRRIIREVALLGVLFGIYNLGRLVSAKHAESAYVHADDLIGWEKWLGLPSEAAVQQQALRVDGLADLANWFYATVHFPLTAAVLLWLMIRRPVEYGKARWAFASLTGLALAGHMLFPLAPPRMMPGWLDTGVLLGQSVYGPTTDSGVANQFAAMPSLHVGWSFMVAVFLIRATRSRWRWLWIAHPLVTFTVVVVTANHYWLDGLVAITLALPLLLIFDARRVRRYDAPAGVLADGHRSDGPPGGPGPTSSVVRGRVEGDSNWLPAAHCVEVVAPSSRRPTIIQARIRFVRPARRDEEPFHGSATVRPDRSRHRRQ